MTLFSRKWHEAAVSVGLKISGLKTCKTTGADVHCQHSFIHITSLFLTNRIIREQKHRNKTANTPIQLCVCACLCTCVCVCVEVWVEGVLVTRNGTQPLSVSGSLHLEQNMEKQQHNVFYQMVQHTKKTC